MKYGIEYQAIEEYVWHCFGEEYSTEEEAQAAIPTLIARGGKWAGRVYRVREKRGQPTHPELVRLVERLRTEDADFAFWWGDDGAEAVLLDDDRVVVAVPGAQVWEGPQGGRLLGAIASEMRERVRATQERADKERAERARWEQEEKERAERERADRERAAQERADKERAERARWEQEENERAERDRAAQERADKERADKGRAERARWEQEEKERAERDRADRERADQERADKERAERARWEREEKERAERDRADRERADRAKWEQEQRDRAERAQRVRAERERAERAQWQQAQHERGERERTAGEHAVDNRAERRRAVQVPSPVATTPPSMGWSPPHTVMGSPASLAASVAPVASRPTAAPAAPPARGVPVASLPMAALPDPPVRVAPVASPPMSVPAIPQPQVVPSVPPARTTPVTMTSPPAGVTPIAPVAPHAKVTPITTASPPAREAPVAPSSSVAPPTVERGAETAPNLPPPQARATCEIAALAKLLRCGAWREGMRSSALVVSAPPDGLPAGAHRALQEVAGVAQPTARELGNALKRFVDQRSDGIARKLTRRVDGHGFAIWQVVDDPDASNPAPERPAKAELVRSALTGTGYRSSEADYAVSALGGRVDTEPLAELVREALGVLARRSAPGLHRKDR